MKITNKPWFIAIVCMVLMTGCKEENRSNQSNDTGTGSATNSTAQVPDPPQSTNALAADGGTVLDEKTMQIKLTTELSQNNKVVCLGRGLYFFAENDGDALDAMSSYLREHTNLVFVTVLSARENFSNPWYTGNASQIGRAHV